MEHYSGSRDPLARFLSTLLDWSVLDKMALDNAIWGLPVPVVGPAPPEISVHDAIKVQLYDGLLYDIVYYIIYRIRYRMYVISHTISYTIHSIRYRIRYRIRHRMYFSSCLKGCKSAGPCLWNLVLLRSCVSRFLQFCSELTSLTCDVTPIVL
jgi:hypothetical protein